ncbi:6-phospho-3-hexuloisomerase [Paenibacillaceae bacterium]|nr:6-phospho-3-hexuloisomerase [Paenibacillaceae bacterium]
MSSAKSFAEQIVQELQFTVQSIQPEQAEQLAAAIVSSSHIFVAGAGRSGLMGKAFAMRLMHMGLHAHVVGETTTPGIGANDLLIIASGSGETGSLVAMAHKAKKLGAKLATVTLSPDASIGQAADLIVQLQGAPKDQSGNSFATVQPMASLFEQTLLLFYDALIMELMARKGLNSDTMYGKHANLE